jgi:hypothetical protein
MNPELYVAVRQQELAALGGPQGGRRREAAALLDALVLASEFTEFLTEPAYPLLNGGPTKES